MERKYEAAVTNLLFLVLVLCNLCLFSREIGDESARFCSSYEQSNWMQWFLTFAIGATCGVVALVVSYGSKYLTSWKFRIFNELVEREKSGQVMAGAAFLSLLGINVVLASMAWLVVYGEPMAGGSGIPEVKCYLNGLGIPRLLHTKTLAYKVVGIILSTSSGLPLGKEGSMVQAGAAVAAILSQGRSKAFQDFRNDKEKRDFVACGASAGVAAAFGSPVGGVLFSLEEGASFWSTKLSLRCFFSGMTAVFVLLCFKTANLKFGRSSNVAMFSFGEFFSLQGAQSNFAVWEISLFVLIGIMGGMIGSVFNSAQQSVFNWRKGFYSRPLLRYLEVVCIVTIMSFLSYGASAMWSTCTPVPSVVSARRGSEQEADLVTKLVPLYCPRGTHYNQLASLYLTDADTCIRQLYHFR
jgi:chloride channel 7